MGRADLLLTIGCTTFVSSALILVIPRTGTIALEILVSLLLTGWALLARVRLKRRCRASAEACDKQRLFDRYDALLFIGVIAVRLSMAGVLRRAGWSEGSVGILPLILFAIGIVLKRRLVALRIRSKEDREVN
jgi:hypothetical protein